MPLVTIVILGAGEIAAATARQLAAARIAARVVMVDEAASVAQGKALDIAQAAPVDRYDTTLVGTGDESAVVGASVVVLADRVGAAGEWSEEAGLALLRRVAGLNAQAPFVCAGVLQRSIVDRGVHELGLPRTRLFGTAPEALRGAIASLVALEAEVAPGDISLMVVGRAPHDTIVPWDSASLTTRHRRVAPARDHQAGCVRLAAVAAGPARAGQCGNARHPLHGDESRPHARARGCLDA
jgi:malate dehydrogenase